jgi:hypothetical protein
MRRFVNQKPRETPMEEFLPNTNETPTPPNPDNIPTAPQPRRERIKMIVIGSPKAVNSVIRTQYVLGFANVTEWSPLQPTSNSDEVMSVLRRQILIN